MDDLPALEARLAEGRRRVRRCRDDEAPVLPDLAGRQRPHHRVLSKRDRRHADDDDRERVAGVLHLDGNGVAAVTIQDVDLCKRGQPWLVLARKYRRSARESRAAENAADDEQPFHSCTSSESLARRRFVGRPCSSTIWTDVAPLEATLDIRPRARIDIVDVRAMAASAHGDAFDRFSRCLYVSPHTTAGYLPQSLATRLTTRRAGLEPYLHLFQTVFPAGAGYQHDNLDLRTELPPEQKRVEPINGDSHLAFMAAGLHTCVSYRTERAGPVYFVDLDGAFEGTPRKRVTRLVGYNQEIEVGRTTIQVPVSKHPIEAVSLKDPSLGLTERLNALIREHGVQKVAYGSSWRRRSVTRA